MKRRTEVEELSQSEDHLHLLQSVQSLNIHHPPPTKDWTEVSVRPSYDGTVRRAVAQLEEMLSKEMKKLVEAELKKVQQYAVDVTLDPDTANPELILSDDGKQSFSSGRFYFEVQVKGKTDWDLGVARESSKRKGEITLSPQKGYWTIWLRNCIKYEANDNPPVRLSLKSQPQKVGVFVDYEEGLVSFYDIDAAALIYSFTGCSFRMKLFPFFCPYQQRVGAAVEPVFLAKIQFLGGRRTGSRLGTVSEPALELLWWKRGMCVCVRGGRAGRDFSILTACWTKPSLSLLVLARRLRSLLPDGSRLKKLCDGWVGSLVMQRALWVRQEV
ncbi:hypothetical protein L3Q82_020131 [Scortum barcoo]|uniref:Uncharacterized protein n=1 Tax=Scortum barcoo TaxID=214431 RepID=A0ACB8VAJ4_9TELE|nr:hypothetical protein L3Q82_020131 [Scortum barcoo]